MSPWCHLGTTAPSHACGVGIGEGGEHGRRFGVNPDPTGNLILQKVHEMLKKGWDTEGSPFRGQKFDPSMFNISPGAVQF